MSDKKVMKVITARKNVSKLDNLKSTKSFTDSSGFLYKKQNYLFLGVGLLLMVIGFILMIGGKMPSPDVWNDALIYSKRITIVSPIFILTGLSIVGYSIFKR
jgi:hypothetical protein